MFEGTVGKSLRLEKLSKIHEIFMVGLLVCRGILRKLFKGK